MDLLSIHVNQIESRTGMHNSDLKDSWRRRSTVLTEIRCHALVASAEKIVLFGVAGAVLISTFSTVGMDICFARIT